eukprot:gnl/TRDRNA2_/TRDRNA2_162932_c0_seq3.p1 gnl/TRDRNA2_/TRDRNA2_162932_c0~~gnl/TRDRNA2_/TRDRNA2_162932_c0_seq3.p1  ORF type:complete len:251 (-),score=23.64 gnl/TRDRNA2_/TRDRNA2_162932_c0_seq3:25-720(-)
MSAAHNKRSDAGCFCGICEAVCSFVLRVRRRTALFRGAVLQSSLGEVSYWDAAYAAGKYRQSYEWHQTCEELWPFIQKALGGDTGLKILHVGCGNSTLGRLLVDAGYNSVLNVDYSEVIIDLMRGRHPKLSWLHADCCKAGALGAADAWDLCIDSLLESMTARMTERGRLMIREVHRVLRPGGQYLIFSNATPQERLPLLQECFSRVDCDHCEGYSMDLYRKLVFVYFCTK